MILTPPATVADIAAYAQCREAAVSRCYDLRNGSIHIANGAYSLRISGDRGRRPAAVCTARRPFDCEDLPPSIAARTSPRSTITGDFRACPLQAVRPGRLPLVCLAGARHVRITAPRD